MKIIKKIGIIIIFTVVILIVGVLLYKRNGVEETVVDKSSEIVSKMSIDEKIGQMLTLSFREWKNDTSSKNTKNVTVMNEEIRSIIENYHLGGVILFAENCVDAEQIVRLTYDMQHATVDKGGLPLLISVDQEGGNITRVKFGTSFSGNMAIGSSGDADNAYTVGKIIGKELDALGINCDFAPVADVNSNEVNPIIGVRSFSGDADVASKMALKMAEGFGSSGVISCAKHFPGHGDTSTDSHTSLPVVDKNYDEWIKSDGVPFASMIQAGNIDMIMTAHIQYPGLDDTKVFSPSAEKEVTIPATMSKRILTDILKGELGFNGVITTDAMNMDAIAKNFGKSDAVIRAIDAGVDIVLMPVMISCPEDIEQLEQLFNDIKDALEDGRLTEERINDAALRVVRLKLEKGIIERNYGYDLDEAISNAIEIVGCDEHRKIEREIALKCINLEYNGEFKNFTPSDSDKIVCVMPREGETFSAESSIERMKKEGAIPDAVIEYYNYEVAWSNGTKVGNKLVEAISSADYLILGFYQTTDTLKNYNHLRNRVFDEMLKYANTDNIAIIWEYLPYGTAKYSSNYPCFLTYNSVGMLKEDIGAEKFSGQYGPAIPAAIEIIFGNKYKVE